VALLKPVEEPVEIHGRRRLEVFNPATLERIGEIEVSGREDVREAVDRARKAAPEWAGLSFERRALYMRRARGLLVERFDEFVDTLCRDTGKPRVEAIVEQMIACDSLTYYARNARKLLRDERKSVHRTRSRKLVVSYRPMGVVGLITPWNFPFSLSLNPTVQALMAGNTVVLKPSEFTPFTGLAIGRLFDEAELPPGVVQVLTGDGSTGAALAQAGCDKISFTGSASTGRQVAEACARQLVPCTLELGGKDPMIVCEDANVERAARAAVFGAFSNAGQSCGSTERVYVVERVAKPFIERVVEVTQELRQGPEAVGEVDVGAIISPAQIDVIDRHVQNAVAKGARVLTGGRRNPNYPGFFYEPTVLVDVNHDMEIMNEETFGPVLPIQVVPDEEEALRLANATRYGRTASVWTRDRTKGREFVNRIDAGYGIVNDSVIAHSIPESPFGGVRESGIGRVNGELGLKGFCHVQSVVIRRFGRKRELLGYPYTTRKARFLRRAVDLLYRSPFGRLFGG
jgi:succinate-semialdehyde dehydrogenase/glutarate-semialdehyde dehydrogenase